MFGLEDLPFPIKILIALLADFVPVMLGASPGHSAIIQFFVAFILTGNLKASLIALVDGFSGYIVSWLAYWFPGTTFAVLLSDRL